MRASMSFLFRNSVSASRRPPTPPPAEEAPPPSQEAEAERFYRDLIDRRPALLDEKLKLHARIIDEFNLALLEKMPHEEFVRQVRAYVANYVKNEKLSLNQREMELFTSEIIDEMIGF